MKRIYLTAVAVASLALGGCATYDYVGDTAPGGYYHGRPSTQYYDPYGGYYGGGVYSGYGYYGPYRYGGYSSYPYYGYYGPYYPYYPHHPRPPRPGDHTPKPPSTGGGDRPPPWRDPTGRWRESGSHPLVPNRAGQVAPAPSQPRVGDSGYRVPRVTAPPSAPRAVERSQRMERAAPSRVERSEPAPRPSRRSEGAIRQQER